MPSDTAVKSQQNDGNYKPDTLEWSPPDAVKSQQNDGNYKNRYLPSIAAQAVKSQQNDGNYKSGRCRTKVFPL